MATLPHVFATLPAGNVPASYLDDNFQACISTGTTVRVQTFTANSTYTPNSFLVSCIIECIGAGGGGGGNVSTAGAANCGSGGGSGAYSRKYATAATIGVSQAVSIGAAGTAGASGNNAGGAGGDTSVGSLCVAKGGSGGGACNGITTLPPVGVGGLASGGTGDVKINGNDGGVGSFSNTTNAFAIPGYGAPSILGGGVQTTIATGTQQTGKSAAANTGAGGGGSFGLNGNNTAGGAGGSGYVIITEFCSQ